MANQAVRSRRTEIRPRSDISNINERCLLYGETFRVAGSKPIVIIVEDDASMLRALRRLVLAGGYEPRVFDRPSALLKSKLPMRAACLLVDIHLPEMDGVQLCGLLSARDCALPVILMTADTSERTRQLAYSATPVSLLLKPFTREALMKAITAALSR